MIVMEYSPRNQEWTDNFIDKVNNNIRVLVKCNPDRRESIRKRLYRRGLYCRVIRWVKDGILVINIDKEIEDERLAKMYKM